MDPNTQTAGPIVRDTNYQSPTYGSFIANPAYAAQGGTPIAAFDPRTGGSIGTQGSAGFGSAYNPSWGLTTAQQGLYNDALKLSPGAVDASKLGAGLKPIQTPNTPVDGTNLGGVVSSIPTDLTGFLSSMGMGDTGAGGALSTLPEQQVVEQGQNSLKTWMMKLFERPEAQKKAETAAGVQPLRQQVVDINNQIQNLQKQSAAQMIAQEDRLAPTSVISGAQSKIERQRAIQMLGLSAISQTLQGNLALAQSQANQAVEMEFAPFEQAIEYQKQLLEYNYKDLDRAEKKRADMLGIALDERNRQLQNAKEDKKIILGWGAEAAKNGAPQVMIDRALSSGDTSSALSILSPYFQDPNAKASAVADLAYKRAQTAKIYADISLNKEELAKKYSTQATNTVIDPTTGQATSELKLNARTSAKTLLDMFNSGKGTTAVGMSRLGGLQYIPGTNAADFTVRYDNLKSLLSLDNVKYLKGQGQVSDAERRLLDAASATFASSQSEPEFKKSLTQTYLAMGGQARVTLVFPDGHTEEGTVDANGVAQAEKDGVTVKY